MDVLEELGELRVPTPTLRFPGSSVVRAHVQPPEAMNSFEQQYAIQGERNAREFHIGLLHYHPPASASACLVETILHTTIYTIVISICVVSVHIMLLR